MSVIQLSYVNIYVNKVYLPAIEISFIYNAGEATDVDEKFKSLPISSMFDNNSNIEVVSTAGSNPLTIFPSSIIYQKTCNDISQLIQLIDAPIEPI